jgi:hypothetical protein
MRQGGSLFILPVLFTLATSAQERVGVANSNYAGTLGVPLNPSSMVDNKVWLDVNIIGLDLFVWNNYTYYSKDDFYFWTNVPAGQMPDIRDNLDGSLKDATVNLRVDGPSATLRWGRHAFGLSTAARVFVSAEHVPEPVAKHVFEGLGYRPMRGNTYDNRDFGVYANAWGEFGLSYGTIVHLKRRSMWNAGITAKYLMGAGHASLQADRFQYNVLDTVNWRIDNFSAEYALAEPGVAGHGWAFDIGVTYKRLKEPVSSRYVPFDPLTKCKQVDYRYRVGLSLIDFGQINYSTQSIYRRFDNAPTVWQDYEKFPFDGVYALDGTINTHFPSNQSAGLASPSFSWWLPTAASLQFDYNFGHNVFANLTYVQGFKMSAHQTGMRRSLISITPRYEIKWVEASLPISLYDYRYPQVGLAFRFYSLIIGSDNIVPFLIPSDVYGFNIYFNLKVSLFKDPKCKGKRKRHKLNKKGGLKSNHPDDCPAY